MGAAEGVGMGREKESEERARTGQAALAPAPTPPTPPTPVVVVEAPLADPNRHCRPQKEGALLPAGTVLLSTDAAP